MMGSIWSQKHKVACLDWQRAIVSYDLAVAARDAPDLRGRMGMGCRGGERIQPEFNELDGTSGLGITYSLTVCISTPGL